MSILNVNQIQPVGGGNTITVNASDVSASGVTITASSFVGPVTGNVTGNLTGNLTGNVTGNVTSSSTSTFSSGINVTGGLVGIGTDNPDALLHAQNNSVSNTKITIESTGTNSYPAFRVKNDARSYDLGIDGATDAFRIYDATATAERLRIASDGQSTFDKGAVGGANQVIARFQAESSRRLDIVWHDSGSLMGFNTPGNHSYIFKCNNTEKLRITSGGAIYINQQNQVGSTAKLEVTGTLDNTYPEYSYPILVTDDAAYNSSGGPGGGIGFAFKQNSGGAYAQGGGIRGFKENTTDGNYASAMAFYTRPNGAGVTERLRITSAGQLNLAGNMQFTAATPEIELNNGGPRFRVPSANTLTIHTGGGLGATSNEKLRIQSGGGISFNGDTAAANALDDYEEGTFLPTMFGSTAAGSTNYSLQYGYYVKVGKLVHFQIRMQVTSSTATGHMRIGGLPFVALNDANRGYGSINVSYANLVSMPSGSTWLGAYTSAGGSHLVLVGNTPGSVIQTVSVDTSWVGLIGGTYIANV